MIAITNEIIGPGIEEEYSDSLSRIDTLLEILKPFPETNDSPEGRLKLELGWLKQEIDEKHLSFPVDRSLIATFLYIVTEGSLDHLTGFKPVALELYTVLLDGLIKPRHYPVVSAMIEDTIPLLPTPSSTREAAEATAELGKIRAGINEGTLTLPLRKEEWPAISKIRWTRQPGITLPAVQAISALEYTLFTGARPEICSKGKLVAPREGLRVNLMKSRR